MGVVGVAFAIALAAQTQLPNTYLLSIADVPVAKNEYVSGFSVNTWGVHMLATCHIPPGWTISAGSSADPSGNIEGEASLGVAYLEASKLNELDNIALVSLSSPVRKTDVKEEGGVMPATFSGTATIGAYGEDEQSKIRLGYKNMTLTPASECPKVKPW